MAISLSHLANIYRDDGRLEKAEELYKQAMEIREKVLSPDHPSVAAALEDYSILLRKLGRSAEADRLDERARSIRKARDPQNSSHASRSSDLDR